MAGGEVGHRAGLVVEAPAEEVVLIFIGDGHDDERSVGEAFFADVDGVAVAAGEFDVDGGCFGHEFPVDINGGAGLVGVDEDGLGCAFVDCRATGEDEGGEGYKGDNKRMFFHGKKISEVG